MGLWERITYFSVLYSSDEWLDRMNSIGHPDPLPTQRPFPCYLWSQHGRAVRHKCHSLRRVDSKLVDPLESCVGVPVIAKCLFNKSCSTTRFPLKVPHSRLNFGMESSTSTFWSISYPYNLTRSGSTGNAYIAKSDVCIFFGIVTECSNIPPNLDESMTCGS